MGDREFWFREFIVDGGECLNGQTEYTTNRDDYFNDLLRKEWSEDETPEGEEYTLHLGEDAVRIISRLIPIQMTSTKLVYQRHIGFEERHPELMRILESNKYKPAEKPTPAFPDSPSA